MTEEGSAVVSQENSHYLKFRTLNFLKTLADVLNPAFKTQISNPHSLLCLGIVFDSSEFQR